MFDKDGDGLISVQEVHDTMKSFGFHIELPRVKLMVKHVDTDGKLRWNCQLLFPMINTGKGRFPKRGPGKPLDYWSWIFTGLRPLMWHGGVRVKMPDLQIYWIYINFWM